MKKIIDNLNLKQYIPLFLISLFTTFTFCLYAPIEMFLSNRAEFWFRLGTFVWMPILFFVLAWTGCVLAGILIHRFKKLYMIYLGLVFGVGFCCYIQSNFLSITVGEMNGSNFDWSMYSDRMLINLIVWAVLLVAIVLFFAFKSDIAHKYVHYVAALLTAMQFVMLLFLLIPVIISGEAKAGTYSTVTSKGLYEVGDKGNFIVFAVDAYDKLYFDYVVENCPELLDELPGFTYYSNYSGIEMVTIYGLLPVVDGKPFYNEMDFYDWVEDVAQDRMFYDDLAKKGYDVNIYTDELDDIPQRIREMSDNIAQTPLKFDNNFAVFKHLYRLVCCKYMPDKVKPYIWLHGDEFDGTAYSEELDNVYSIKNRRFLEGLEKAGGVSLKKGLKSYKMIHVMGAHAPYDLDENGDVLDSSHYDITQIGPGGIRYVLKYINYLKDLGVYDDANIIITSDHGCNETISNGIMLIKPSGSAEGFAISNAPVWPEDFSATVADMIGVEDYNQYGTSIFDVNEGGERERFAYLFEGGNNKPELDIHEKRNCNLVEYRVPSDTNDVSKWELTDKEICANGEVIEHKKYCIICQENRPFSNEYLEVHHQATKDHPFGCDSKAWE